MIKSHIQKKKRKNIVSESPLFPNECSVLTTYLSLWRELAVLAVFVCMSGRQCRWEYFRYGQTNNDDDDDGGSVVATFKKTKKKRSKDAKNMLLLI